MFRQYKYGWVIHKMKKSWKEQENGLLKSQNWIMVHQLSLSSLMFNDEWMHVSLFYKSMIKIYVFPTAHILKMNDQKKVN